ncbi:DUF2071 domain-containing protein [Bacillus lacus]|uniref:DUF2071 domain-containing protein n=1 Tax=Metabacillus lacus TaxID=1983721 RepID=A0A7X2J2Q4_9BACI|nr:DUF2071 domain-containing protein [Metabacillus lacus]MRX74305.1 DUF2071 domain-containing protein [Metabacillus lacus]
MKKWILKQTWRNTLFLHWPVDYSLLRSLVPEELEIDRYDGEAWLGVLPFEMHHIRPRYLPSVPYFSRVNELNVRTYVTYKGRPGVYFFSLDANRLYAVLAARRLIGMNYLHASISSKVEKGKIHFQSRRIHPHAPPAEFEVSYQPVSEQFYAAEGTLQFWFTERYIFYAKRNGKLMMGEMIHQNWPLQLAECTVHKDTLTEPYGGINAERLQIHFAKEVHAHFWPIQVIAD